MSDENKPTPAAFFQVYDGKIVNDIQLAAQITEENVLDLANFVCRPTRTYSPGPNYDRRIDGIVFDDDVAEIGDYIIADLVRGFQPFDKELFELHYRR